MRIVDSCFDGATLGLRIPSMFADPSRAVFLSYASQDAESARRVCTALRAAGVEVWFDQSELRGGDAWDQKIRRQIKECALFVPIISANTQARLEGYFRLEWKLAEDRSHLMAKGKPFIMPVCIDDTRDWDAHVPDAFTVVQWTRLPAGETSPRFCERVKALLESGTGILPVSVTLNHGQDARATEAGSPSAAKRPPRYRLLMPAFAGLVIAVTLAFWRPWNKAHSPETKFTAQPTEARQLTLKARALVDDDLMAARENFRFAEEFCQRAIALAPDDGETWATLARISCEVMLRNYETNARRREQARSQSERAARLAPTSVETGLATAAYLEVTAEYPAAQNTLRALLVRAPADVRVAIAYARILGRLNQPEEAQEFRRTYPALAGDDPRALTAQAWALRTPGGFARALELVNRAQAMAPSRQGYFIKLLLLVVDSGDLQAGVAFVEELPRELLEEDVFAALVTRAWLRTGDAGRALALLNRIPQDFFEEMRRVEPKGYLTGRALQLSGKPAAANAEWTTALAVVERRLSSEPHRPIYLRYKAVLQALTGNYEEAERTWRLFTEFAEKKIFTDVLEDNLSRVELLLAANREADAIAELLGETRWSETSNPALTSLHYDPWFAPVRKDPRVQEIITRREAERAKPPQKPAATK